MTAGGATVGLICNSTFVLVFHHLGNKLKNGILSTFLRKIVCYSLGKESSIGLFLEYLLKVTV